MPKTSFWLSAVQGVVGFYDHCVDLQAKGKFVESIVQFSQAPGEVEMVSSKHPDIKSLTDFKGKSLGVTGLGSSTNFLTLFMASKARPEARRRRDGPGRRLSGTFIAAMQQDQIQASMRRQSRRSRA